MKFVEWCLDNKYENVLDCFIGEIDDVDDLMEDKQIIFSQTNESYNLINTDKLEKWKDRKGNNTIEEKDEDGSTISYWFKCEKCNDIHKLTLKEAKSRIQNSNDKMFLCKRCQLFENSENETTLDTWLNQHKEIKLVGRVDGELDCVIKIKAECISSNSNIKVMVRYNERTSILEVKGLTKGNTINSFQSITFKDWCLIFYRYPFVSYLRYIENKEVKSRKDKNIHNIEVKCRYERYYTGKQVIEHYDYKNNSKAKIIRIKDNEGDFEIDIPFYGLPYSSTEEPEFLCDNYCKNGCKGNVFKSKIKNITDGTMWCDSDINIDKCVECGKEAERINKSSLLNKIDLNDFLRENCTKEEIKEILAIYNEKNKIFKNVDTTSNSIEKLANEIISSNIETFKVIKNAYKRNEKRLNPKILKDIKGINIKGVRNEFIKELKSILDKNEELHRRLLLLGEANKNPEDIVYIIIAKSKNTLEYDFLITLDKMTIKALDKGILYGRPIILKDNISEKEQKLKSINNKVYSIIGYNNLKKLTHTSKITKLTYNNWNNLFNGLSGSFKNTKFTMLDLSDIIEKIRPGCFIDCEADKIYFPKHISRQLKYKYVKHEKGDSFYKIEGTCNNDVASRRQPQIQGTNFIQYNDVFRMGEALRVYEDHLTLYRGGEVGQGFREYEYIDNFEYQKFYGDDPDDLVLSLLLALNEKVIVSEVTDALIDIYNEIDN